MTTDVRLENDTRKNPTRADELPGHVVVVDTVYCQMPGDQPCVVESRSSRILLTREQPYERRVTVGEEWTALNTGWIERASMMKIMHRPQYDPLVNPTEAEREAVRSARLVVALVGTDGTPVVLCSIPPGEDMRVPNPSDLSRLRVRATGGAARVVVVLFPE